MSTVTRISCALITLTATFAIAPSPGLAAASADISETQQVDERAAITVNDWTLCVSKTVAQTLTDARREGTEAASQIYNDLASQKKCFQIPALEIVQGARVGGEPAGSDANVIYAAVVHIAGAWSNAVVISSPEKKK